jgi:cytochrome c biogenesis protein CcmG/thiol:disulfide interchange protein DsbE
MGVGAVVALLVVLLITRQPAGDQSSASPIVGKRAPALEGTPIQGKRFVVAANDRWLLVNFFATWCTPCVAEHPELRAFSEEHQSDGKARVVSVVYGDKPAQVRKFFGEHKGTWTVLDSDDGRTALDWGVAKVPESFLVSPTGVVLERFSGGVTRDQLDATIASYEKGSGVPSSGSDGNPNGTAPVTSGGGS